MFRQVRKHAASTSSVGHRGGTPPVPPTDGPMYFEAVEANSTVLMVSMLETAPNLEYSTDGVTWQEWEHTTAEGTHTFDTITLGAVGDRIYLRGDNPNGFKDIANNEAVSLFSMTGKIAAGGNAQSIVDGDTPTLVAKTMPLFSDMIITEEPSDVLTQAPVLPATTLADGCYSFMFAGCAGLASAPELPATELEIDSYSGMFFYCSSLTDAPALPASVMKKNCYSSMFDGCTGLTSAPALPATTLAKSCYYGMFTNCTSLTSSPSLPVTELDEYCYYEMFYGCESLETPPSLPATTLAKSCYCRMFFGCESMTNAPALPAEILVGNCYTGMFENCVFSMSDDGSTLNFDCAATLPQTVAGVTYSTPAELANWMGNTNGFTEP